MARVLGRRERRTYLFFSVLVTQLGQSLGVNGGAVFQILASENLGLTAEQIGLAVGLGAISIPFQIAAARIPLAAAHRNLRAFVFSMAAMNLVIAWLLVGSGFGTTVVVVVIIIAILAELAVSVLWATSFQPLLATTIDPASRQWLNGPGRAVGGALSIGLVALVGTVGRDGRIAIVIAIAVIATGLGAMVSKLRRPVDVSPDQSETVSERAPWDRDLVLVFVAIGFSVVPAWPFAVTYAADVFAPSINLGLVGAASTGGWLIVSALWRPTTNRLLARARLGAFALLVSAVALVLLDRVSGDRPRQLGLIVIVLAASGAGALVRMGLLEMAHARASAASSVSILTLLDVVASTAMQVGFVAAGFLISASARRASTGSVEIGGLADPFQWSLIGGAVALIAVLSALREPAMRSR